MSRLRSRFFANSQTALRFAAEILKSRQKRHKRLQILLAENSHFNHQVSLGLRLSGHQIRCAPLTAVNPSDYDLVLPFKLDDIERLRPHEDALISSMLPIPSADAVALCSDKLLLDQKLQELRFGQHIPEHGKHLEPPFIIKKRVSAYSADIHPILTPTDLSNSEALLNAPDHYCQRYIEGQSEYALHAIMRKGRLAAWLNIGYHFSAQHPVKGQIRVHHNQIEDCEHLELFENILQAIGFQGLCCINYKLENDRPMLLEINPRFGGSLRKFFFMMVRQLNS